MTRHDQLTLDINFGFTHTEVYPAPVFLEHCSVARTAVNRRIVTVHIALTELL